MSLGQTIGLSGSSSKMYGNVYFFCCVLPACMVLVWSCVCRRCLYRPQPARATVTTVLILFWSTCSKL